MTTRFQEGDAVRLSPAGVARAGQMPEAWGLHTAATRGEVGEVVEVIPPEQPGESLRLSVDFPSGGVYNWEATYFVKTCDGR